ncbi:hypothetical protein PCANC_11568 [Puccinia coronata f. sp. avenae]|uniref:Uncharacterized protein n=1 Tax=Puccinia coronata f. sp. avenae TaxID=200324 RepID=A0A2N5V7W1_9BASI|nr:hypothetical protein PCANC_11568 [Puccinia coronata f. sp. avenae]
MTAISASVYRLNNCAAETMRQGTPFTTFAKQEGNDTPKYSFHMKSFLKDLMQLHWSIHSNVEYLKFNGKNFTAWERQLNTTLEFVFHKDDFLNKNGWVLNPDHKPSVAILFRSSVDKVLSSTVVGGKSPREIYKMICDQCKRCDRQHKLNIVNQLGKFFTAKRQPSNTSFLQHFQEFFVEIQQKQIDVDKLLGLILQSIVKPPTSADKNAFQNNLAHHLNTLSETPSFDRVCQEITQVKGELVSGSSANNPILVNRAQPVPPNSHPNQPTSRPTNSFGGTPPNPTQMAEKGSTCNYCGRTVNTGPLFY